MRFYVGVTDNTWFNFLSERKPSEVNFWQPGGAATFRALSPGELFLFKLHSPLNFISGGGVFVKHSLIPLSMAWEAFGIKNGTGDLKTFREKVFRYRGRNAKLELDPTIGCIILAHPFFLEKSEWLPAPEDWHPNIVQGKTYATDDRIEMSLLNQVKEKLLLQNIPKDEIPAMTEETSRYGLEYITRARLGQGAFRVLVTDAYSRRCAMTGEKTLPVLESAHIKPYASSGPHSVDNGLLLRSDVHKLFDLGYITLTTEYRVEVSNRIREEYENGRDYYALQGRPLISLPHEPLHYPSRQYIEWHNNNVYLA